LSKPVKRFVIDMTTSDIDVRFHIDWYSYLVRCLEALWSAHSNTVTEQRLMIWTTASVAYRHTAPTVPTVSAICDRLEPWRWRQYISPKRYLPTSLHGVTTQNSIVSFCIRFVKTRFSCSILAGNRAADWRLALRTVLSAGWRGASGQRSISCRLTSEERALLSIGYEAVWTQSLFGLSVRKKSFTPVGYRTPAVQPVAELLVIDHMSLTLWRRGSSKCYLRIQSVPQREHQTSPLQRSSG
jgi:hypothetical protein